MDKDITANSAHSAELNQLIFELHRLIFTSHDLINHYAANLGMHSKDGEALLQIWQAELLNRPLSPSELAEQLHITRAAVTYLTERLVESGYIYRETDSKDRRKTALRISESGGKIGHDFTAPMQEGLKGLFAERSREELATFSSMLQEFMGSLTRTYHFED